MILLELDNDVFYQSKYNHVFHMVNAHGFAYAVDHNALMPKSQSGVSVTVNGRLNWIQGRDHLAFKFVLLCPELLKKYGGYYYTDYYTEIGSGGRRTRKAMKEDEIRINSDRDGINPLNEFTYGVVIMFELFTQKAVQDLMYTNKGSKGMFSPDTADASRGIDALYKVMYEWKKPIWKQNEDGSYRNLTKDEMRFIKEAHNIASSGGGFQDAMREIADKFPLSDHFGKQLDKQMVIRRQMSPQLVKMLNDYYAERKYVDVDINEVKKIWGKIFDTLGINSNVRSVVWSAIERSGLLHPTTAAVEWGGIIRDLMDGDVDEVLDTIKHYADGKKWNRDDFDKAGDDSISKKYATHYGTMF